MYGVPRVHGVYRVYALYGGAWHVRGAHVRGAHLRGAGHCDDIHERLSGHSDHSDRSDHARGTRVPGPPTTTLDIPPPSSLSTAPSPDTRY